jgi:hypothetical protein
VETLVKAHGGHGRKALLGLLRDRHRDLQQNFDDIADDSSPCFQIGICKLLDYFGVAQKLTAKPI